MQNEWHCNGEVIVWCWAVTYTRIFSGSVQTLGKTACIVAVQFCTMHTINIFSACGGTCHVCCMWTPKSGRIIIDRYTKSYIPVIQEQKHILEDCRYVLEIWGQNKSNNVVSCFSSDFLMWFFFLQGMIQAWNNFWLEASMLFLSRLCGMFWVGFYFSIKYVT